MNDVSVREIIRTVADGGSFLLLALCVVLFLWRGVPFVVEWLNAMKATQVEIRDLITRDREERGRLQSEARSSLTDLRAFIDEALEGQRRRIVRELRPDEDDAPPTTRSAQVRRPRRS